MNCNAGGSIQGTLDSLSFQQAIQQSVGGLTVLVGGVCNENVSITTDDVTLSGNTSGAACDPDNPGGSGAINGTVTVRGVRANIEFLTLTGAGAGVDIVDRATVDLDCNNISNNEETGVNVLRNSNAFLTNNKVNGNGTRETDPNIFFDSGLFVADASSVQSLGNTYSDNQYAAIDVERQSTFRNGDFQPVEPGHPADPTERDTIVELGCDLATGTGCFTTDEAPVAIAVFNGGLIDIRNADVAGESDNTVNSSLRIDGDTTIQGNINNNIDSLVRIKDRSSLGDRIVTYTGTLSCSNDSKTFFGDVVCGQTCAGAIPGTCAP